MSSPLWEAAGWIDRFPTNKSRWACSVFARLWIGAIARVFITYQVVRGALLIAVGLVAWRSGLADAACAVLALRTIIRPGTSARGGAGTILAFTVAALTARDSFAVTVLGAVAEVGGVDAGVGGIAQPIAGALLIEVAAGRRSGARSGLGTADFTSGTVAAVIRRVTVVVGVAPAIDALLPDFTVFGTPAGLVTDSLCAGIIGRARRKMAVLAWLAILIL